MVDHVLSPGQLFARRYRELSHAIEEARQRLAAARQGAGGVLDLDAQLAAAGHDLCQIVRDPARAPAIDGVETVVATGLDDRDTPRAIDAYAFVANAWQHTEDEVAGWLRELGVETFRFNDSNPNGISVLLRVLG